MESNFTKIPKQQQFFLPQGKFVDISVKVGDKVTTGQTVICIEAMKMENNIRTDRDGIVKAIAVQTDNVVIEGELLMQIE